MAPMDQANPLPEQQNPAPSLAALSLQGRVASLKKWFQNHPHKKIISVVGIFLALVLIVVLVKGVFGGIPFSVPRINYVPVYTLVNDKISQHGAVIVNLPKGVSKTGAETKVTFDPVIKGKWVSSSLPDAIVYKPSEELTIGKHYLVALATDNGTIKKDFLVDEDPAVVDVFPSADAEADQSSAITIVFNRPMVPLTTLSELENKNIPVTISPETKGKFKWISTRTLQFIPNTTLIGSTHYAVTIRPDFVSTDGLAIKGKTYNFTTKQLRLDHSTSATIVYSQPISFYFNQPIDLDKTGKEITLSDDTAHKSVDFVASYGQKVIYDPQNGANKKVEDRSVLSLLPKNSLNGHANVWNFDTQYSAIIKTAYPVGGDITLSGSLVGPAARTTIKTSPILKEVNVESDKTGLASLQLFDPNGKVTFSFYEDIDTGKSSIRAKGLKKVEYGEKCQENDDNNYSSTCKKVNDKSQLIVSFDPSAYARDEQVPVTFERLTNTGGYQVNAIPVIVNLTVYPQLRIIKIVPTNGSTDVSVKDFIVCTNVPLKAQEAKEFYQNFKANKYIVFGRWDNSYLQTGNSYETPRPCAIGDYVNKIRYGLLPQQSYTLNVALSDVFGQKTSTQLSFKTGSAPKFYLRFQNLQKIYNVTTPEHTKLTYATENFDYVNLSICKVSPDSMVRYLAAEPSEVTTTPNSLFSCLSSVSKKIPLKTDQWVNQYFQVDIKDYFKDPRGQYVLSFSHPQYQDEKGQPLYGRTYLSITNLAVTEKRVKWSSYDYLPDTPNTVDTSIMGSVYWVSQIHSILPTVGATVKVYKSGGIDKWGGNNTQLPPVLADLGNTNASGFEEFPLIADVVGATITSGQESAVVSTWADTLSGGSWQSAHQEKKMYLYTDRPIYRPGQEVFIKGLYRLNFDGLFQVFQETDIKLEVTNSKREVILSQKLPVSNYGTLSASVTLPADAPLGTYNISAGSGYAYFDVAEYVGAAFETKAETNKDEYIAGDTANITVSGKYYFGVPLDGGTFEYSLSSQNFYFDRYTDDYFNFGSGWYYCYDCGYGDTYLKRGKATLNAEGVATIAQSLDFNTLFKDKDRDQSKVFVLHGTIKDKQGKSVSFQKSFIVHRGDFYLGAKTNPSFTGVNQPVTLHVKTVDVQGKPIARNHITVVVNKITWQSYKRQEVDGGFYNRYEQVLTPVITKNISTNYSGDYSEQIKLTDPGQYEIDAAAKDDMGNDIKSISDLYIYGAGTIAVRPTNNATLDLKADKTDVKVGENAKFLIQSPYPHAKALISIERGRIFTYEVVDINQSIYKYEFPITEDYSPNVFASVVLLSPTPEIKFGQLEFTVDRKAKELSINIKSDKTSYLPGEKVTLTVTTTDSQGRPVPANVSLAVADLSVLALKGNPKKDPLLFFYNGFPLTVTTEANIKNLLAEAEIPTGTKGGDGANPEDLATRKRGEFKDTAFWQADVETNGQGVAQVSFTLPDNLTKWQIESVGITKDTKLGVQYQDILAQKGVMTIPLKPRFIVPGDEFMIGAKIFNQTQNTQVLDISLESQTLDIKDTPRARKTIKTGETNTVYFKVKAPEGKVEGAHTFTLSAKNNGYNDTVEQTIPITRNMTYESTATANSTSASSAEEYLYLPDGLLKDRGGLTIKTSATLAVYLSDALKYLFQYPYGCSEQLASKLSAMAITKRALAVPNVSSQFKFPTVTFNGISYTVDQAVDKGLAQLYDSQNSDGGFAYYKGLKADPYLSIHVLNTLIDIKAAGYTVRQNVIDNAVQYLYEQVPYYKNKSGGTDTLILLAYALSRVDAGSPSYTSLVGTVTDLANTRYLSDNASSNTLGILALLSAHGGVSQAFKDKVFASLSNRVDIDSRGAYVKPNQNNIGWFYYETPEKDTALFLKALVADKREYSQIDKILRWLLASRASDGSWGSTNTSVAAIDALSDYLTWKRETESDFILATTLDGKAITSTTFNKQNVLSTIETFLPIAKLEKNKTQVLAFTKTSNNTLPNNFYYDISLKYYLPVQQIAPRDEGVAVTREFYSLTDKTNTKPLVSAKVGDVIRGVLTIISPKQRHLFAIEDYIPAGFELIDFSLATEDKASLQGGVGVNTNTEQSASVAEAQSSSARSLFSSLQDVARGMFAAVGFFGSNNSLVDETGSPLVYQKFYPDFNELHDDRLFLFAQDVSPGAYTYEYYLRATTPGTFSHLPAVASDLYFPENFGRTAGSIFTVEQ
ncbi:MAG: MG2 domain-containing protein [bacterium]|nr:MG2 domain-containing protein [bacterium]